MLVFPDSNVIGPEIFPLSYKLFVVWRGLLMLTVINLKSQEILAASHLLL